MIVGLLAYIGTLTLGWERSVEILNFGALMAFMAVNAAALKHFGFGPDPVRKVNIFLDIISPGLGFLFCLVIFLGLQSSTLLAGAIWLAVGGVYLLLKTRGPSARPVEIDFSES
jgi:amino acid transporter